MVIDSYKFGEMVIDGKAYHADLVIYPDRIDASWWRKTGHAVWLDDLQDILLAQPKYLVVGTGSPGLMEVLPETQEYLAEHGIELIVEPTAQAYQTYNELCTSKRVIGAFHLTC
jgi:hypothetical protein